jgi:hypothetical protein
MVRLGQFLFERPALGVGGCDTAPEVDTDHVLANVVSAVPDPTARTAHTAQHSTRRSLAQRSVEFKKNCVAIKNP